MGRVPISYNKEAKWLKGWDASGGAEPLDIVPIPFENTGNAKGPASEHTRISEGIRPRTLGNFSGQLKFSYHREFAKALGT